MPRVSVLTPIYNTNPAHLRQCIESILNQTFTDFEFLILNDSPENTELDKVVKSYDDARIKYIRNEQNIGISASRNKLIQMARGEYLAIFDHDDISVPTRLARQVEYLDTHPDIGVVSGWLKYFGVDNSIWKTSEHDTDIRIHMVQDCSIAHTAAMLRKSILVNNDIQYEEFYSPAEDYRLWARLMAVTKFYNIQDILVYYRWNQNNTSCAQNTRRLCAWRAISMELQNQYPAYTRAMLHTDKLNTTIFRLRLFGFLPLIKIKNNWVLLFDCIPLFKLKWN